MDHPAKLKKQRTLSKMMSASFRRVGPSTFMGASFSIKRATAASFKKAGALFGGSEPQPSMDHAAVLSSAELVKKASALSSKKQEWAGTLSISDEEFDERFFVREKLGEGSYGTVHRVIRVSDGAELAAKTIEHRGHDGEWAEALEEARVWKAISSPFHPSILPLLEVLEVEGRTLHLVTELMPCDVLGDAIFNVIMSEQAARLIMVQLASAVAHLHMVHGMAHRDIKPDNVLCASPDPTVLGCLKLADFGLCKPFRAASAFSSVATDSSFKPPTAAEEEAYDEAAGTIDYAAPELAAGFVPPQNGKLPSVRYGPGVDVWALGCVCYELLHGQPPFYAAAADGGEDETVSRILAACGDRVGTDDGAEHPLPLPESSFGHVSSAGIAFLRELLSPSVSERVNIREVLAHEWLQPVQDDRTRIAMCSSPSQSTVSERRAERTNSLLRGVGQKIMAANRMAKSGVDARSVAFAENVPSSKHSAKPARVVKASDGSFRAKSATHPAVPKGQKAPKKLVRAPSTVSFTASQDQASVLSTAVGASVLSTAAAQDASPPASELDPMAHYVGVYKSLFGQNDLFGSPERQQIADTAKSQGLSLKELSAVAEKRAKEKRLRALEELEA